MKFLPQANRDQLMLLPPSINDFVEDGHIARTIDEDSRAVRYESDRKPV